MGSYAMDGLAMALHCVYTTGGFREALVKVSRGDEEGCTGDREGCRRAVVVIRGVALLHVWLSAHVHYRCTGGEHAGRRRHGGRNHRAAGGRHLRPGAAARVLARGRHAVRRAKQQGTGHGRMPCRVLIRLGASACRWDPGQTIPLRALKLYLGNPPRRLAEAEARGDAQAAASTPPGVLTFV